MRQWILIVAMILMASSVRMYATEKAADEAEWPCFNGPNHDGKSPDKNLLKEWPAGGPAKLWQFTGLGKGFSTVSVSDNTVYASGDVDGQMMLFALDMYGKLKWKIAHDSAWPNNYAGARSTPTVDGDRVYLLSAHGMIGCYSTKDGAKVWTRMMRELGGKPHNWGFAESVLIEKDMAIVTPGGTNCITALDKMTGKTIWMSKGFDSIAHYGSCTPFTYNNIPMIAAGTGGGIFCVDARNGEKVFSNTFSAGNLANCSSPAASDGFVFWSNGYGKGGLCMKLGPSGAEQAWVSKDLISHHGGYLIENGCIYGNHERGVACLDLKTGQKKWSDKGVGKCSLTYADGMLYLFGEADGVVGLAPASPDGFKLASQFNVQGEGPSWAHPVVIGGHLFLRYDTNLYCFDVKAK